MDPAAPCWCLLPFMVSAVVPWGLKLALKYIPINQAFQTKVSHQSEIKIRNPNVHQRNLAIVEGKDKIAISLLYVGHIIHSQINPVLQVVKVREPVNTPGEYKCVSPFISYQVVTPWTTIKPIVTRTTPQDIVVDAAEEHVVSQLCNENIVAGATVESVVARTASHSIRSALTCEHIVPF